MTSNNFKQDLLRIEQELRHVNENDIMPLATRKDIMTKLYCLLHSNRAVKYFLRIFQRTGAKNTCVAKDIEDYISEVWITATQYYDPNKGPLLPFLTMRMQNKIIDDERKMGGLGGLPRDSRERARFNLISVEQDSMTSGIHEMMNNNGILDGYSYTRYRCERMIEIENSDLLISDYLHSISATILHYVQKYPVQRWKELEIDQRQQSSMIRKRKKYFYYRLFYSSDIISIIKENNSTIGFRHEREAMDAMHFGFTNYVTDRCIPYHNGKELTPAAILIRPLARNCDVAPSDNTSLCNSICTLSIPIQNEIVRGYMEHEEGAQISSSNISQMKQKYRCDMRGLLSVY